MITLHWQKNMWTTCIAWAVCVTVTGYGHVIISFCTRSQMCHSLTRGVKWSHLFSVRAVRLKWRMSWWRGSGFVSFSSSSSSSSSIAFYISENKNYVMWITSLKIAKMQQSFLLMVEHIQTGHQSFCLQRNILQFGSSSACTHPGTC